jgi:thioredoxin reductase (NADPH)
MQNLKNQNAKDKREQVEEAAMSGQPLPTFSDRAFPRLTEAEIAQLLPYCSPRNYEDGDIVLKAGDEPLGLVIVLEGTLKILNPADDDKQIVTLTEGQFNGDIDVLMRRPPIVTGQAGGPLKVLRVPLDKICEVLIKIPVLSEKLVTVFEIRRELFLESNNIGLRVVGPAHCKETTEIREFLFRNFVPFIWHDIDTEPGQELYRELGSPEKLPAVEVRGAILQRPRLPELAEAAGIWKHFDDIDVDLLVIGAGPSGIAAAVYGASEGLKTLVLDKIGPGGQAGGSSKIENFIGFPAGLSGNDLALRGAMQVLKFDGSLYAPVEISSLEPRPKDDPRKPHEIKLNCGATVHAKVVLLATGMTWRKLDAENAEKFERNGVHYSCTSVEAVLYDKMDVGVIGAGNSAGQAATFLAACCPDRKVHIFARGKLGSRMSQYLHDRCLALSNIVIHENTVITRVIGTDAIEAVDVDCKGEVARVALSALFVFIGAEPGVEKWLPDDIARDANNYLLIGPDAQNSGKWPLQNRTPCALETTVPGILAAGDVRSGSTKRVGFAVGDGAQSVACVHELIAEI